MAARVKRSGLSFRYKRDRENRSKVVADGVIYKEFRR